MNKLKNMLSSPARIAVFALCVIAILALLAFAAIKVGASVMNNQGIGLEKATQIALENAGFKESEATLMRGHFDRDDGLSVYEIEFRAGGYDYDYVISSGDGTIIEVDREYAGGQLGGFDSSASANDHLPARSNNSSQADGSAGSASDASNYIGVDKAKELALQDAGVILPPPRLPGQADRDDGIYDIEFVSGNFESPTRFQLQTGYRDKDIDSIYD
ncbi:MAG: PepSY domain-containing protein [Oscillospiraceae bacterium]